MRKEIKSTRLRYILGTPEDVTLFIEKLSFKIEIKSILEKGNKVYVWFNIPDNIKDFKNIKL